MSVEVVYFVGAFRSLVALIHGTINQGREELGLRVRLCTSRRQAAIFWPDSAQGFTDRDVLIHAADRLQYCLSIDISLN
jgi:hypothetical protein